MDPFTCEKTEAHLDNKAEVQDCLFALAFTQTLVVGGINVFSGLLINRAFGFDVRDVLRSNEKEQSS